MVRNKACGQKLPCFINFIYFKYRTVRYSSVLFLVYNLCDGGVVRSDTVVSSDAWEIIIHIPAESI